MLRGLYESALGMNARLKMQDVIANNLANVNSTGFQREMIAVRSRPMANNAIGSEKPNSLNSPLALELAQFREAKPGVQQETGNKGDVALSGEGYMMVQADKGLHLFRSGTLQTDAQGYLALTTGQRVKGADGGAINVGSANWSISAQGVVEADGNILGRLRIVRPQGELTLEGGGISAATSVSDVPSGAVQVRSGYLERSNVNTVNEMVDMITGMRAYEASQRAITAQDQTLQNLFTLLQ